MSSWSASSMRSGAFWMRCRTSPRKICAHLERKGEGPPMTEIRIIRISASARKMWRALTDPALIAQWGMRPEGFAPEVGNRSKFVGEANKHWRGYVECEVLEARAPLLLALLGAATTPAKKPSSPTEPRRPRRADASVLVLRSKASPDFSWRQDHRVRAGQKNAHREFQEALATTSNEVGS